MCLLKQKPFRFFAIIIKFRSFMVQMYENVAEMFLFMLDRCAISKRYCAENGPAFSGIYRNGTNTVHQRLILVRGG